MPSLRKVKIVIKTTKSITGSAEGVDELAPRKPTTTTTDRKK